jgi:hypothetical protein
MAMATPEEQLGQILAILGENSKGINELKTSMTEMRALKTETRVDHRVHKLEHGVLGLGERLDHALGSLVPQAQPLERPKAEPFGGVTIAKPPLTDSVREDHFASLSIKMSSSADLELLPPRVTSGSLDHGKSGFGVVYTVAPTQNPVTGVHTVQKTTHALNSVHGSVHCDHACHSHLYQPCPPKTPFPEVEFHKFDGSNPKLWIKHCETYFDVYQTDQSLWVHLASMRLTALLLFGSKPCMTLSIL